MQSVFLHRLRLASAIRAYPAETNEKKMVNIAKKVVATWVRRAESFCKSDRKIASMRVELEDDERICFRWYPNNESVHF